MYLDYSNQRDWYYPNTHGGHVTVVGAGGIGSPTVMGLTRMGVPKIDIWDDDMVEPHNCVAQFFNVSDIDEPKAHAIAKQAERVTVDAAITPVMERVTEDTRLYGEIVVSAVDNMKSRKEIYETARKSPSVTHLIDGRLGGQLIVLYVIDLSEKDQREWYTSDDIMFPDSEMESEVCTARSIIDVSHAVSALVVRSVRMILTGQKAEKLQMLNMGSLKLHVDM